MSLMQKLDSDHGWLLNGRTSIEFAPLWCGRLARNKTTGHEVPMRGELLGRLT